jgi:hypothetical protein
LHALRRSPDQCEVRRRSTLITVHTRHNTAQFRTMMIYALQNQGLETPRRRCRLSLIVQATTSWRNSACGLYGALQLYTSCSLDTAYRFAVLARINSELYSCTRTIRPTRSEGFEKVHLHFCRFLKASMVGFTLVPRSYYYLRRRSPGLPFLPDHRQGNGGL